MSNISGFSSARMIDHADQYSFFKEFGTDAVNLRSGGKTYRVFSTGDIDIIDGDLKLFTTCLAYAKHKAMEFLNP